VNERMVIFGVGAGLVLVIAAAWAAKRAGAAAVNFAGTTLNPASPENFVYGGVNGVGAAVSGNASWSLGTWLAELTRPGMMAAERAALGQTPPFNPGSGATGSW